CPGDGLLDGRIPGCDAAQVDIRTCVDEEVDAGALGTVANRLNLCAQYLLRAAAVFDVDARGSGIDDTGGELGHRVRVFRIAALHVDGERHANDASDLASSRDEFSIRENVVIGVATRPGESRTGRRNRLGTQALNQPRAAGIPGVREQQHAWVLVETSKYLCRHVSSSSFQPIVGVE